jgi:hypothetical protein
MTIKKNTKRNRWPSSWPAVSPTQIGCRDEVQIPAAAILYDTTEVSLSKQDKIDHVFDHMSDLFESTILN